MKLSVITINYNNVNGLNKTIKSVLNQTLRDFEWIIIDGGSTDGAKELIQSTYDRLEQEVKDSLHQKGGMGWVSNPITYWCSEPDKGIYNAMNKGIAKARGEYLLFLNSGDSLADETVLNDFSIFCKENHHDIITGDLMLNNNSSAMRHAPEAEQLDIKYMMSYSLNHPCSFIKRELFDKYGKYDETLQIVADWKWFLFVTIIHNCSYTRWQRTVSNFMTDGMSEDPKYLGLHIQERDQVLESFLPRVQSYIKEIISEEYVLQTYSLRWFVKNKLSLKFL